MNRGGGRLFCGANRSKESAKGPPLPHLHTDLLAAGEGRDSIAGWEEGTGRASPLLPSAPSFVTRLCHVVKSRVRARGVGVGGGTGSSFG